MSDYVEMSVAGVKCRIEQTEIEDIWEMYHVVKQALLGVGFHNDTADEILYDPDRDLKVDVPPRDIHINIGDIATRSGFNSLGIQADFYGQGNNSVLVHRLPDGNKLHIHFPKYTLGDTVHGRDGGIRLHGQLRTDESQDKTATHSGQMCGGDCKGIDGAAPAEWDRVQREDYRG